MPAEDYQSWSTTAGSNASADTGINWAEGQPRASVNNSARSMMAAHAKDRNLRNGSITTAGTANAQTFTSGVGYTGSVPTGLAVKLKVGVANTGAMTLNMDGIGAVAVKDMAGRDPSAGAFTLGQYVDLVYNGTNWILLLPNNALGGLPQCGRLEFVSATSLSFKPFKGDQIKINGAIYNIPSAGIAGLGNTGVFLNGVAGQNLIASQLYYVYCFNNSGVLTGDFSTTHATSATAGNVGVEIKSGDDTRTLIGMVFTNASAQFVSSLTSRTVVSWFNRRRLSLAGTSLAGAASSVASLVEINSLARVQFLPWAGEAVDLRLGGVTSSNIAGAQTFTNIGLDAGLTPLLPQSAVGDPYAGGALSAAAGAVSSDPTEAFHFATIIGSVTGGATGNWFTYISGSIRG